MGKSKPCPVTIALDIVGGKWKPIILWRLLEGPKRFSELEKSISGITQKMLTSQLRGLERDKLISRTVYPQVPPKVEYAITEHGRTLLPVLNALNKWGETYQS